MDGYISEQGHRLTPFQTQQAASQKGATLWFRKHPYSRLYIICNIFMSSLGKNLQTFWLII